MKKKVQLSSKKDLLMHYVVNSLLYLLIGTSVHPLYSCMYRVYAMWLILFFSSPSCMFVP